MSDDEGDPTATLHGLAGVYFAVAAVALLQFARIWRCTSSWTTQRTLHGLVLVSALVRGTFDILAERWWQVPGGLRTNSASQHLAFYVLDELPGALFFSIMAMLVLFWAEVYYTAADQTTVYKHSVRPCVLAINAVMYVGLALVWLRYATLWQDTTLYISGDYAGFQAALFSLGALALAYYGRHAFKELSQVPVGLQLRASKLREVGITTVLCTTCFLGRSFVLLWCAFDVNADLDNAYAFKWVGLYFALSEVFPSLVVLWFFRKVPRRELAGSKRRPIRDAYAYQAMGEAEAIPGPPMPEALRQGSLQAATP